MFPGLTGTPAEVLHMSRMSEKRKGENNYAQGEGSAQ